MRSIKDTCLCGNVESLQGNPFKGNVEPYQKNLVKGMWSPIKETCSRECGILTRESVQTPFGDLEHPSPLKKRLRPYQGIMWILQKLSLLTSQHKLDMITLKEN